MPSDRDRAIRRLNILALDFHDAVRHRDCERANEILCEVRRITRSQATDLDLARWVLLYAAQIMRG